MANTVVKQGDSTKGAWQVEGRCCAPYAVINVCKAAHLKPMKTFLTFWGQLAQKVCSDD